MNIDMIGFDADDTLWHTEIHYLQAQEAFKKLLSPWGTVESISEVVDQIIIENLSWYGYGIKAFILSLIEAAIHISQGEIRAHKVDQILSIGKMMLAAEIVLRPHVLETLQTLVSSYPMMVITKGDLLDQTTKLRRAGIGEFFSIVEVVNEKSPEAYARVFENHQLNPKRFLMVGNTIRSDIQPVLALGGTAVHIPADSTWEHELVPGFDTDQNGFYELEHMGQLSKLISRISNAD
jgi:putative hydrolase of the HAD superfamily